MIQKTKTRRYQTLVEDYAGKKWDDFTVQYVKLAAYVIFGAMFGGDLTSFIGCYIFCLAWDSLLLFYENKMSMRPFSMVMIDSLFHGGALFLLVNGVLPLFI